MDVGHITLMGNHQQQAAEADWRRKVSQLRQCIVGLDAPAALGMRLARQEFFHPEDRRLIEAALDGVDQETVADFIYLLMWRIQGEVE